ncbi:hypothetical protein D6D13_07598 [Aureobasidium pullulans]|uniref:Uncharacterized protein n=2 Tax=Aureobasidium pullulans TaxID=5580 RepID=A0A4S9CD95_AURPU|nr:hypothetical protein D6D13_07598 [Aureobasidium pullulans]
MNQDQAQHRLWLLDAPGSPTLPLTYCNDINMSLGNHSMDPGQLPEQCHFNGSITPFADLQQVENWPYPTTDYNLQALTALQLFGRISQSFTHLQDTTGSFVADMTQDVSLMDNHPISPAYHSDIGNPTSFCRDDSNNLPRPSQRPSQRRYSFATLDSSFQHVCFERCCGGPTCDDIKENGLVKHTCPSARCAIAVSKDGGLETNIFCDLPVEGDGDLVVLLQTHLSTT